MTKKRECAKMLRILKLILSYETSRNQHFTPLFYSVLYGLWLQDDDHCGCARRAKLWFRLGF